MVALLPSSSHRRRQLYNFLGRLYDPYTDFSQLIPLRVMTIASFCQIRWLLFDFWNLLSTPMSIFNDASPEVCEYPYLLVASLLRDFTSPLYSCR
jgi:hypothetical protein